MRSLVLCVALAACQAAGTRPATDLASPPRIEPVPTAPLAAPPAPPPAVATPATPAWAPVGWTASSTAAFCARWKTAIAREVAADLSPGDRVDPVCGEAKKVPVVDGRAPGWRRYRAIDLAWYDGRAPENATMLVIERDDGTLVIGPRTSGPADVGCFSTPELVGIGLAVRGDELLAALTYVTPRLAEDRNFAENGGWLGQELTRCPVATLACASPETLEHREITEPQLRRFRRRPPAPRFR